VEASAEVSKPVGDMNVDLSVSLCNLSFQPHLRQAVLDQGGLTALTTLAHTSVSDCEGNWRCAAALRFLALRIENRVKMVEVGTVEVLVGLAGRQGAKMETQRECCAAVCSLSKCPEPETRLAIVRQGAMPLLIKLSKSSNAPTVRSCSVALSNLSAAGNDVDEGTVSALISMSIGADGDDAAPPPLMMTTVAVTEDDLPPSMPLRPMQAPTSDAIEEVRTVHVVTRLKQTAGMAGSGPPTECPDLMQPKPLPLTGGGAGGDEDGEEGGSASGAGRQTFPKLELTSDGQPGAAGVALDATLEDSYGEESF
jgi:hypothetical protein